MKTLREKMKSEMEKALGPNSTLVADVSSVIWEKLATATNIVLNLSPTTFDPTSKNVIRKLPNSHIKTLILNEINKSPYYGDVYASELRKIFCLRKVPCQII